MSERRMFAKTIIDSDAFLDMPLSTQALYFHLSMRADDDGFINNPKKIQRMIGASDDDLKVLIAKNFIIPFESGIVVIKHWRIHNYIRGDRKHDTKYTEEMGLLSVKKNGSYTLCQTDDGQMSDDRYTEIRLGKDRLGKDNNIIPPKVEWVADYCKERNNTVDAQQFFDFYESKNWFIGKNKMKDWKAAVRTWERNRKDEPKKQDFIRQNYDFNALQKMIDEE